MANLKHPDLICGAGEISPPVVLDAERFKRGALAVLLSCESGLGVYTVEKTVAGDSGASATWTPLRCFSAESSYASVLLSEPGTIRVNGSALKTGLVRLYLVEQSAPPPAISDAVLSTAKILTDPEVARGILAIYRRQFWRSTIQS
jgi:hypothetical protein